MSRAVDMGPAANEEIPWRSPNGPRARLAAGGRYAHLTRGELLVMISGGVLGLILMLMFAGGGEAGASNSLPLLFGVAGIAWMFGYLVFYVGYNRVSRIILTDSEIRHAIGFPWPRHETIPRADVRSVVVYEGDGTVLLLGGAGELLRARHLAGAADFAEALGTPTVAWPVRSSGDPHLWMFYLAFWLAVATVPMFFVAVYPGAFLGIGAILLLDRIADLSGSGAGFLAAFLLISPIALLTFGLASILALFLSIAAGRFLFRAETMNDLLHSLSGDCAHWSGCPDLTPTARRPRPAGRYTLWCARIVGAELPPDPAPDLRGGMTPDKARTAMALAEGAG
jgi:hypothetical protein